MNAQPAFVSGAIPVCSTTRSAFVPAVTSRRRVLVPVSRRARIVAAAVPLEVTEDSFESEVLQSDVPVLVDFYAPWCGPCKLVAPLMDWAAIEFDGSIKVVKIDTDEFISFVKKYGIHGLPTFAVFKEGEAFGIQEGALGKVGLEGYLKKHVEGI